MCKTYAKPSPKCRYVHAYGDHMYFCPSCMKYSASHFHGYFDGEPEYHFYKCEQCDCEFGREDVMSEKERMVRYLKKMNVRPLVIKNIEIGNY